MSHYHRNGARQEFLRLATESESDFADERFADEFEEDPGFTLFPNRDEERESIIMARGDHIRALWLATA